MKTLWAVKTPKGKLIHESIARTKWESIIEAISLGVVDCVINKLHFGYQDPWVEAKKLGFKCVKVKIVEIGK